MSNYNSLKTTIDANIKQNGRQEITGQILNSVLNQMVNILGTGYQFVGVATIDTNPGAPDAKVFYIANGKGTYTNFGGLEVTEDEVVILYYDTEWHKVSTGIASQEKLTELGQKWGEKSPIRNYEGEDFKIINTSGIIVAGLYDTQRVSQVIDISEFEYITLDLTCPIIANNACAFAFYDDNIDTSTGAGLISVIQYPEIINNNLLIKKPSGATKVIVGYLVNPGAGWFGIKNFYGITLQDAESIISRIDTNVVATNGVSIQNYSLGTSYLDGEGKLQTAQYSNRFITEPITPIPVKISISGNRFFPMVLFYDDNINFATGTGFISGLSFDADINEDVMITADMIPSNATKMVFNGIYQPPTYFGVVANKLEVLNNNELYQKIKDNAINTPVFLSPNGSDTNDGKTPSAPRLSIQKAIDDGYKNIILASGEYKNQQISINNIDGLSIICDADSEESNLFESHHRRSHAKIDNSIDVNDLSAYNSIYRTALSVDASHSYYKVFISQELPIIYNGVGYYGQSPTYNAILWEMTSNVLTCKKVVPVLTISECETTPGTFTYDGTYLYVHPYDSTIIGKTYKRLNLDGSSIKLVSITNSKNIFVQGVDICFSSYIDLYTYRLSRTTFRDCVFSFTCYGATCEVVNSDISFYSCTATHAANDGWGVAGYGNCSLYNCNGVHCYDDGVSHHDASTGCIDGGEWCYNAKGGITPSYGSRVNVQNIVSHHNLYGVYYVANSERKTDAKLLLQNCLMYDNTTKDLKVDGYNVISHGCQYRTKIVEQSGNLEEYGNNVIS